MSAAFSAPGHPLQAQLMELAGLEANWDGLGSPAIDRSALTFVRDFSAAAHNHGTLVDPDVVAQANGGLCLRWRIGNAFFDLVIDPGCPGSASVLLLEPGELNKATVFDITGTARGVAEAVPGLIGQGTHEVLG